MRVFIGRISTVALLGLGLWTAGCTESDNPIAPSTSPAITVTAPVPTGAANTYSMTVTGRNFIVNDGVLIAVKGTIQESFPRSEPTDGAGGFTATNLTFVSGSARSYTIEARQRGDASKLATATITLP